MSTKFKTMVALACFLASAGVLKSQTVELVTGNFVGSPAFGPTTSNIGPASMRKDASENNQFTDPTASQACTVTFSLANQQYSFANNTMLNYSNINTGLVFGASPTTASGGVTQGVDPLDTYRLLGAYTQTPGGPTDDMFTAKLGAVAGTGIDADGIFSPPANDANGSVVVFTAAQALFERPAGGAPSPDNSSTRYYYGDLKITFSRFVNNPVIHIAGLGGSYRYFPVTGNNINDPSQWQSTFFSTELDIPGFPIQKLSGNPNFAVNGNSVTNSAAIPNGASVATVGGLFQEYGAASGSVVMLGPVRTLTIKVYLRGCDASQFPWSATASNIAGATRNPFTGDIWSVSVSAAVDQLIPLPATGMHLDAVLNSSNNVQLSWKTLSETDTKEFQIQRSTDGVNFTTISTKAAAGNSASELSYALTDPNMQANVYYYRVKLVDNNNTDFAYSNVAMVRKSSGSIKTVRAFPNPATGPVSLEFSNAKGNYVIGVYNQDGQQVASQKAQINYEVQYVPVSRNTLPAGSYMLKIRNTESGEEFNQKVILQ